MTITFVNDLRPIQRPQTVDLAEAETSRMVTMLRSLTPEDWIRPTDCTEWDVRALAGHVLGMTENFSSLPRFVTSMVRGGRAAGDGPFIDGLTALQVRANAPLSNDELIHRMEVAGPVQARWRGSRRLMRAIPMKNELHDQTVSSPPVAMVSW